ncbi:Arylformamidase [Candidatus Protofrankia datiscae]|uniref:Arylformamidase n=1 Tax=Candidatus Protofrankia datiscae TaxID=2716812 RepID=F8B1P8_9ACTN|nr:Arylformamidase [Candidatus Protofrankia datiscae]
MARPVRTHDGTGNDGTGNGRTTAGGTSPPSWETSRELRDQAYSPSLTVPDMRTYLRMYADRSADARATLPWKEISYGDTSAQRLHFFPAAGPDAPLQVFIHGGYWQELSKEESSFAAPDFVTRGAAFAALGYGLASVHRLGEIVAMVRNAILWIFRHAAELGVDPQRIFLSGSSAGAHLAAMCVTDGWLPPALRPFDVIRGACLLSGIYDLEPLRHTYVGEQIGLTAAEAARNSPIRHVHGGAPPLIVARGDNETAAFAAQHRQFVSSLTRAGTPVADLVVSARNHFDLPLVLGDPETPLGRAVLTQMGLLSLPGNPALEVGSGRSPR